MKRVIALILASAMMFMAASVTHADLKGDLNPDWINSLVPEGTPGAELALAESSIAKYDILLPADSTAQEGDELTYLADNLPAKAKFDSATQIFS